MPYYSDELIEEVRSRNDIVDVIGKMCIRDRDSVRLIDGSYTKRVMLVTIITNIIDGVLTIIWMLNDRIMNSEMCIRDRCHKKS